MPLNKGKTQENLANEGEIAPLKQDDPTEVGWMKVKKKSKNTPALPTKTRSQSILAREPIGWKNTKIP